MRRFFSRDDVVAVGVVVFGVFCCCHSVLASLFACHACKIWAKHANKISYFTGKRGTGVGIVNGKHPYYWDVMKQLNKILLVVWPVCFWTIAFSGCHVTRLHLVFAKLKMWEMSFFHVVLLCFYSLCLSYSHTHSSGFLEHGKMYA